MRSLIICERAIVSGAESCSKHTAMKIVITGTTSGIGKTLALYYAQPGVTLGLIGRRQALLKPRQHMLYVYASLSQLDFRGVGEKSFIVSERATRFSTAKKPTALMMHWCNGGHGGVCAADHREQARWLRKTYAVASQLQCRVRHGPKRNRPYVIHAPAQRLDIRQRSTQLALPPRLSLY